MTRALLFLVLPLLASAQINVLTYHNNLARTGENLNETILMPANVNPAQFGQLFFHALDGQVYAQPLYMSQIAILNKGVHNVVFVATEHDSIYAFDADANTGVNAQPLWHVSFIDPAKGITTASVDDVFGCSQIQPEIGISGTPVIDPSTNTLYAVAMTNENGTFYQRLHALDITTGAERTGSPVVIAASVGGSGDGNSNNVAFYPQRYKNRPGLLLLNGIVYTSWSSHCDASAYHGWVMAYDAHSLEQVAVFNNTPDGDRASYWMGGAAPAADSAGNIYLMAANGKFDVDTGGRDFGETFIKLSTNKGLGVADYFAPFNQQHLTDADIDVGSSGPILLPDSVGSAAHRHLLTSAGKEGRIYVLDRDNLGHYNPTDDSQIVQSLNGAIGALFGSPAYFNNTVYFSGVNDALKAFPISGAQLAASPSSRSAETFGYPGSVPSISADGSSNGIVWVLESNSGGILHAYDAGNLSHELFNSNMSPARDALGSYVKYSVPTVANGKVYAGTANSLAVYGLLSAPPPPVPLAAVNAASFQAGPVAPGALVSIFGTNLAGNVMSASPPSLPLTLGGTSLAIDGVPAPLLYVSPNQINAQIPFETLPGSATVMVRSAGAPTSTLSISISSAAPGLFTTGQNRAAVQNADGSLNSPENPAAAGSTIAVYLTGQGAVSPAVPTGSPAPLNPFAVAIYPVTATLRGLPANVGFSGLSPGSVGLFQVNLTVPALESGSYPLVISINGVASNSALVTVSGQ